MDRLTRTDFVYAPRALFSSVSADRSPSPFVQGIRACPSTNSHVALPQLYGAPAYARPPTIVATGQRPFDPDELPIEAFRTDEEREFTATLPPEPDAPGGVTLGGDGQAHLGDRWRRPAGTRSASEASRGRLLGGE